MNEKGLVANILYLAEASYGEAKGRPTLSVGAWVQYFLDNFATVEEAVREMENPSFVVDAPILPNGRPASGHVSISDKSGDSAIFEYLEGKLVIHHGREYNVMTNSPPFHEQLALVNYWRHIGGDRFLPGTIRYPSYLFFLPPPPPSLSLFPSPHSSSPLLSNSPPPLLSSAADRFVRTDYLLSSTPKYNSTDLALAAAFSLIRSVGVPLGMTDPEHPNISMTLWRSVSDTENLTFYFDSVVRLLSDNYFIS